MARSGYPHISPLNTIAYYTAVQQTMSETAANKFVRLYLFPGGYHCAGGEGPFTVDLLSPIMAWVERGTSPNALLAAHTPGNGRAQKDLLRGCQWEAARRVWPMVPLRLWRGRVRISGSDSSCLPLSIHRDLYRQWKHR